MDPITGLPAILSTSTASTSAAEGTAPGAGTSAAPLTPAQKQALAGLHSAAQQFESVFLNMLFKEMRKNAPPTSLTGKPSNADNIYADMLDEKRAESLSRTGSLGIGKMLEEQLKASVLANADTEAKTRVPTETDL
jgi:flagellar protein FlgJ